jgi:hypothetical protein
MRDGVFLFLLSLLCLGTSCSATQEDKAAATPPPEYNPITTIKDIMNSHVDPSADHIWQSVGAEITEKGLVEKAPRTEEEWKEERRHAILLTDAANLLMMPGRRVAQPGDKAENPEYELSPEQIESEISATRRTFLRLAKEYQTTAIEILQATDKKDLDGILRLGAELDMRCENCHKTYWYPNDPVFKDQPKETDKEKALDEKK